MKRRAFLRTTAAAWGLWVGGKVAGPFRALADEGQGLPIKPTHAVSLGLAHRGTLEIDTMLLDSYGRLPEEVREFYLTSRGVLAGSPDATLCDPGVIAAAAEAGMAMISGPMLGDLSPQGVCVWFRPARPGAFVVHARAVADGWHGSFSAKVDRAGATTRVRVDGLKPSTEYEYEILNGEGGVVAGGAFRTTPAPGAKDTVRVAFGSCFHKIGVHNPNLMRLVAERGNHAMLLLGDIAVDDRDAKLNMHYADYLLRDVSKPWRELAASTPLYASWDDHDYLNNDRSGLHRGRITESQRNALRELWQENWVNPEIAVRDRGIYFSASMGDIEIIMLDTRSCRDEGERGRRGAYLGEEQMAWLLKTLKASKAKFIIVTSGTMWSDFISKGKDSWGTWDVEFREELYAFIEQYRVGGVLFLSGDRHGARGFKIVRPSGFCFYEFEAATLGGVPGPESIAADASAQLFGYGNKMKAFGEFTFELGRPDPSVTFRLIDEAGTVLEEITLRHSQLVPPAS